MIFFALLFAICAFEPDFFVDVGSANFKMAF